MTTEEKIVRAGFKSLLDWVVGTQGDIWDASTVPEVVVRSAMIVGSPTVAEILRRDPPVDRQDDLPLNLRDIGQ